MTGLAVFGITGRMGQCLVRACRETGSGGWQVSGGLASAHSENLGRDASLEGPAAGVWVTADPSIALQGAAVAVDFSRPEAIAVNAHACAAAGVPLLVGTTGFDKSARAALTAASADVPVLVAPNTSVGVNVVLQLVAQATAALGTGFDVEIGEAHHRMKRDAPSGTALALAEAVAGARGQQLVDVAVYDRRASGARAPGSIGFAVVRAGDIVGEHTVTFAAAGERVEITHRATDRMAFARGALFAAGWLRAQPAGLYGMADALRENASA